LGLYATIDQNWEQLAVENLFNKGSWSSADGNNGIRRGRWRTVRLKAIYEFYQLILIQPEPDRV